MCLKVHKGNMWKKKYTTGHTGQDWVKTRTGHADDVKLKPFKLTCRNCWKAKKEYRAWNVSREGKQRNREIHVIESSQSPHSRAHACRFRQQNFVNSLSFQNTNHVNFVCDSSQLMLLNVYNDLIYRYRHHRKRQFISNQCHAFLGTDIIDIVL